MTDPGAARELVRAVVRGDADISDLSAVGVSIRCTDEYCAVDEPAGFPIAVPTIDEIATGTLVHWARSTGLRDWARVVLSANFVDLTALENQRDGQGVLDILWSASAGEEIEPADLDLLRSLASR